MFSSRSLLFFSFFVLCLLSVSPRYRSVAAPTPTPDALPDEEHQYNSTELVPRSAGKKCGDGGLRPCVCNDALSLRIAKPPCDKSALIFTNAASTTDASMKIVTPAPAGINCDHMVELQFVKKKMTENPAICKHFQTAAGKKDFKSFFDTINSNVNLINVDSKVNNAKATMFGGKNFGARTVKKSANGLAFYLKSQKAKEKKSAAAINKKMDQIMGAGKGFKNFAQEYNTLWDVTIPAKIKAQVSKLKDTVAPTKKKAKTTKPKTVTPPATGTKRKRPTGGASGPKPPSAKKPKTVAPPPTKPATKKPVTKKPVTKASTAKKTAAKKKKP